MTIPNTVLFSGSKLITKENIGISNWYWPVDPNRINPDPASYSLNRYCVIKPNYVPCCWAAIETSKGIYNWTFSDTWVNSWHGLGKSLIVELGQTPDWANVNMTAGAANKAPTNMADFASWVTVIGNRYKNKIRYWIIRNEPNFGGTGQEFIDTAAKYAEMTRIASQILKSIDPNNKILGCEMVNLSQATTIFTQFANASASGYDAGFGNGAGTTGKNWIDIVSTHTYKGNADGNLAIELENIADWATFKNTLISLGISNLPIWATEYMYVGNDVNGEIAKFKRNFILSIINCDMSVWFSWGRSAAIWNKNNNVGMSARTNWNDFVNPLLASPITLVVLNNTTDMVEVTLGSGYQFLV